MVPSLLSEAAPPSSHLYAVGGVRGALMAERARVSPSLSENASLPFSESYTAFRKREGVGGPSRPNESGLCDASLPPSLSVAQILPITGLYAVFRDGSGGRTGQKSLQTTAKGNSPCVVAPVTGKQNELETRNKFDARTRSAPV